MAPLKILATKIIIISILLSSLLTCADRNTLHTNYLFILYDAGETLALLPVAQKMLADKADFRILRMGTSRHIDLSTIPDEHLIDIKTLTDVNIDNQWPRYQGLAPDKLAIINTRIKADKVITGTVSKVQEQLAQKYSKEATVFGYVDYIGRISTSDHAGLIETIGNIADYLLVPAKLSVDTKHTGHTRIVGQPVLDTWLTLAQGIDTAQIKTRVKADQTQPIVTFIGGYGGHYPEAFKLFMDATPSLTHYRILISPHPKTDGSTEETLMMASNCRHCQLTQDLISTLEAVTIADIVICYQSTVGVQALFLGKTVIYIDLPNTDTPRNNPDLQSWHLSQQVASAEALIQAINQTHNKTRGSNPSDLFVLTGIPDNSAERIYQLLKSSQKENHRPAANF